MFMLYGFYMCVFVCAYGEGAGVISHGHLGKETQRQQEKQEDLCLAQTHTESSAVVHSESMLACLLTK